MNNGKRTDVGRMNSQERPKELGRLVFDRDVFKQTVLCRVDGYLLPVAQVEFCQDVCEVNLDCMLRQGEVVSNLPVARALPDEDCHLSLSVG